MYIDFTLKISKSLLYKESLCLESKAIAVHFLARFRDYETKIVNVPNEDELNKLFWRSHGGSANGLIRIRV